MVYTQARKQFTRARIGVVWFACASAIFWGLSDPSAEIKNGDFRCPNAAPPPAKRRVIEEALEGFRNTFPQERLPGSVKIPVYFHIITNANGSLGDISDQDVQRQIDVLNSAFAGTDPGGAGANTPFRFELQHIDRTPNDAWFNMIYHTNPTAEELAAKAALNRGDKGTLNLYTAALSGSIYGWARFPWELALGVDGVVVRYSTLPGGTTEYFNQGDTATHEVGHWLGLYHTFEGNCNPPGDYIADTNPGRSPATHCPTAFDSCPTKPGFDAIHNFMNFVYDYCMYQFTRNQSERMDDMHRMYRT